MPLKAYRDNGRDNSHIFGTSSCALKTSERLRYRVAVLYNYIDKGEIMALADRTKEIVVPYSLDCTFEALKKTMPKLGALKVNGFDEDLKLHI